MSEQNISLLIQCGAVTLCLAIMATCVIRGGENRDTPFIVIAGDGASVGCEPGGGLDSWDTETKRSLTMPP